MSPRSLDPEKRQKRIDFLRSCANEFRKIQKRKGVPTHIDDKAIEYMVTHYDSAIFPQLQDLLQDSTHLIDRHKIATGLALTIMECSPFMDSADLGVHAWSHDFIPPPKTCRINALFAVFTAVMVFERWHKHYDSTFLVTPGSKPFLLEHSRYLSGNPMMSPTLSSQAWYLVERVCMMENSHESLACANTDKASCADYIQAPLPEIPRDGSARPGAGS